MSDHDTPKAGSALPAVLVVGMHRSGTSAVTGALASLGLLAPSDDDLLGPGRGNELGHFESRSLTDLDDRLLSRFGGRFDRPPTLPAGFEDYEELADLRAEAPAVFAAAFDDKAGADVAPAALFKDPRLALLLPFWRSVLARPLAVVLVARHPLEAARSLAARDGTPLVRGLALYERHVRAALSASAGLPVFVCDYAEVLADPSALVPALADLLKYVGVEAPPLRQHAGFLDAAQRHQVLGSAPGPGDDDVVLESQLGLYELCRSLVGVHPCFDAGALGVESPWTTQILRLESDLAQVFDGLQWAAHRIEPLLRAPVPETTSPLGTGPGENGERQRGEDAPEDPERGGPYPLNASEDRRAYHRWLQSRHLPTRVGSPDDAVRRARTDAPRSGRDPLVSVLVPVWRTPLWALERCVASVLDQSIGDFELCLSDDASGDAELTSYLGTLRRRDRRIKVVALEKNGGISAATNAALAVARGRFVAFLDHDDELAPHALETVAAAIAAHPDADVLYSDEDKIDAGGERFDPLFKPEWSPDLLLSFAYTSHLTVIRRELVVELGGLRSEYDGSQDYDLSLRATERARRIVHLPEVLYHWRTLPGSAASDSPGTVAKPWAYVAGLHAIEDALARRGEVAEVTASPIFPGRYHVRRAVTGRPLVSIIIPFRDEPSLLATCVTSMRAHPGYDNFEFVLVDNGSELPETAALLDEMRRSPDVRILSSPGPFNWAAINNAAAHAAAGEVLLFSNNDIEARADRWLEAMLGDATRAEVGAVGARLLYPDGAIQHAGVVVGLGGIAGHVLRGLPGDTPGYNSMAIQTRDCSVVTGACMMTRREVFESVGGFDEELPVAFNDVDFCLKLRERDYLVVYTPLAELIHHESRSRGHTDDLAESSRILERWAHVIATGDPYLNVHLSHWRYWCPLSTPQESARWKTYLETSVLTPESSSNT